MKKLKILLVSLLTTACGSKVFANSDCGDPSKGKFTCDTDQISLEYTEKEIKQNGWFNQNAGSGTFIYGPYLDIDAGVGKFKEKSVHASVPVSAEGGRGTYPCTSSNANVGLLLYTVQLTASNVYGRQVILDSKNVYRTWNGDVGTGPNYGGWPQMCVFGISIPNDEIDNDYHSEWARMVGTKYVNLSSSRVPSTYSNFQIIFKNVDQSVRGSATSLLPLKTEDLWNKYILPSRDTDQPIFLNINGFR